MALIISLILSLITNIVTEYKSVDKSIAITFDACETKTPAFFDKEILNFIVNEKLPVTIFLSGKFIERNKDEVHKIAKFDFIEIENHSYSHANFNKLSEDEIKDDVKKNEELILETTGKKPNYFRFPYGYYDEKSVEIIKKMNYKIVHWTFPSGDPDKNLSAESLKNNILKNARSGAILIFHINGRGWKTKEVLPEIVKKLKEEGYRFVLLKEVIN